MQRFAIALHDVPVSVAEIQVQSSAVSETSARLYLSQNYFMLFKDKPDQALANAIAFADEVVNARLSLASVCSFRLVDCTEEV